MAKYIVQSILDAPNREAVEKAGINPNWIYEVKTTRNGEEIDLLKEIRDLLKAVENKVINAGNGEELLKEAIDFSE